MISLACVIGILLFLFLDFKIVRNLASPLVLAGGIWLMQYIFVLIFMPLSFSDDWRMGLFFICFVSFFVGFKFFTYNRFSTSFWRCQKYAWNPIIRIPLIISMYVFSAITIAKCWSELNVRSASIWQTMIYCMNENDLFESGISVIFLNLIPIIFMVSVGIFTYNPSSENRNNILFMLPPTMSILLFSSRGGWFLLLIALVYIYVFVKEVSNKKILVFSTVMLVLMFFIWGYSSLDKFATTYAHLSDFEKLQYLFSSYFINPTLNFLYLFDNIQEFGYGKYTFRFICAVLSSLFPDVEVVETISPFLYLNGAKSNVYTAVGWVFRDFGMMWVYFVFFVMGIFYGFMYKKVVETKEIFFVVLLSVMMTPIAYFFFDDIFFSRFSLWLQRFIFVLALTSPVLLVKER
ncbi:MAG: oligosaccharide repeat unit polymerase [Fibrobacter sp.]|nr:oligosaccharide repeat unit polymerase [Fibrobacter sp.]